MFKHAVLACCGLAFSAQGLAQTFAFQPALRVQLSFGGAATQAVSGFDASLGFHAGHAAADAPRPATLSSSGLPLLSLRATVDEGSTVSAFGAPVLSWDQPSAPHGLSQSEQGEPRSWWSRNGWWVGLTVVAVGVAAANSGSSRDEIRDGSSNNQNNCGVSGSPTSPGSVVVDPNCPRG